MALFVEKERTRIRRYRPFKPLAVIYVGQSPEDRFWRAAGRIVAKKTKIRKVIGWRKSEPEKELLSVLDKMVAAYQDKDLESFWSYYNELKSIIEGADPTDKAYRDIRKLKADLEADTEWQDATKELDEAYTELQMPKKKKKPKKEEGKGEEGVPEKWYQKKVGPLKLWHWIAIGGGIAAVIGLWLYLKKK